ncbi:hypothetical protein D3C71_2149580 [compost metagenome]
MYIVHFIAQQTMLSKIRHAFILMRLQLISRHTITFHLRKQLIKAINEAHLLGRVTE